MPAQEPPRENSPQPHPSALPKASTPKKAKAKGHGAKKRTPEQQEIRRAHDRATISQMIALYCAGNHKDAERTQRAHCGEPVCPQCAQLDAYAQVRIERCPFMDVKISCDRCEIHCYSKDNLDAIRQVMRYSGPRMLLHHPLAAVRHALGR